MSEPMEPPAASLAADTEDGVVSLRVRELIGLLAKAVRAHQMYQANNPVYSRFLESLREAYAGLWAEVPALRLRVEEAGFAWEDETFAVGGGRDSLAFQFYKDGVRHLTFLPGFEEELERFLEVVVRARQLTLEEDDLVTLLWEQDFECFQYGYVDALAEGIEVPTAPEAIDLGGVTREAIAADTAESGSGPGGTGPAAVAAPGAAGFSREDFKETLYFLDENELDAVRTELDDEWSRDPKAEVLNALFDRLEDPIPGRQAEILGILRQLLPAVLGRGDLATAALILQELEAILAREEPVLGAEQREAVDALFDELSEPGVLGQLVRALEDGAIDPAAEELSLFLARLRSVALPELLRAIESVGDAAVRDRLRPAADRLAERHPSDAISLIDSADEAIAAGAARAAGRLRLAAAIPPLIRRLRGRSDTLRLAALEALLAIRTSAALDAALRALDDPRRDIRIAAARGLGGLRYSRARGRLEKAIEGRALRNADLTERLAFFEAYADVAGVEGVPALDRLLNARGLLGRRPASELRACAAAALGRINNPAARASLEQASRESDPVIRNAVSRALRREAPQ